MVKKLLFSTLMFLSPLLAVAAEDIFRVVAVVNSTVITSQDLNERYELILRQLPKDLPEAEKNLLRRKTLNALIDEEIKVQYAKKLGLTVPQGAIKERLDLLTNRNENFKSIVKGLEHAAEQQIKNDILWQKVIERRIQSRVSISTEEIDRLIESLLRGSETTEREISQIFVPIGDKKEEVQLKQRMEQVYNRLKEGANFKTMAQAFSADNNASKGGYLGWFSQGELSPVLESALKDLPISGFTKPLRSAAGWHILRVENMRKRQLVNTEPTEQVYLIQLSMLLPEDNKSEARDKFKNLAKQSRRLATLEDILRKIEDEEAFKGSGELGWMNTTDVPSFLGKAVKNLWPGQTSKIIEHEGSLYMIYLASKRKKLPEKLELYRERVRERLIGSRVELMARKFTRDLRRKAFIDIKL